MIKEKITLRLELLEGMRWTFDNEMM